MGYMPLEDELDELHQELGRVRKERERALRGATNLRARELELEREISKYHRQLHEEDGA